MGDHGGLAHADGYQHAHFPAAVIHPQQQYQAQYEGREDEHADQGAAHHGAHALSRTQHAGRVLVVAGDLVVLPIHRQLLRVVHGLFHINAFGEGEGGVLVDLLVGLVLVQLTRGIQIRVYGVGGQLGPGGHLPVAVALENARNRGGDACRGAGFVVGIIRIGPKGERIAHLEVIGFGEILVNHRHVLVGSLQMASLRNAERMRGEGIELGRIIRTLKIHGIAESLLLRLVVIVTFRQLHRIGIRQIGGDVLTDDIRSDSRQFRDALHVGRFHRAGSARRSRIVLRIVGQHKTDDRLLLDLLGFMLRRLRYGNRGKHACGHYGQDDQQNQGPYSFSEYIASRS